MREERRAELRRRYLSLGTGELTAAGTFAVVALLAGPRLGGPDGVRALWSAVVPLLVVLVQAGAYWLLARTYVGRAPMPTAAAAAFRACRVADVVVLAAGLAGVVVWWPGGVAGVLVAGVWAFGVVEYVNYFAVRLSWPARTWLAGVRSRRVPRLVLDLREASAR